MNVSNAVTTIETTTVVMKEGVTSPGDLDSTPNLVEEGERATTRDVTDRKASCRERV